MLGSNIKNRKNKNNKIKDEIMFRLKIEKIRSILFERGLSIISISRAIGESENMIYKIFREQKYVRPYLAVKIANFLRSEVREIAEKVNECEINEN